MSWSWSSALLSHTYFSPNPCRCCPMSRITSSSDWERRFCFFRDPAADPVDKSAEVPVWAAVLAVPGPGSNPLECANSPLPLEHSPFCALLFWQLSPESCP